MRVVDQRILALSQGASWSPPGRTVLSRTTIFFCQRYINNFIFHKVVLITDKVCYLGFPSAEGFEQ